MSLLYYWLFMPIVLALAILLFALWRMRHPIEVIGLFYNKTKNQLELKVKNKKNKTHHIKSSLRLIQPVKVDDIADSYRQEGMTMLTGSSSPSTRTDYDLIGEDEEPQILGPNEIKTIAYDIASPTADVTGNDNVLVNISYGKHSDFLNNMLYGKIATNVLEEVPEGIGEPQSETTNIPDEVPEDIGEIPIEATDVPTKTVEEAPEGIGETPIEAIEEIPEEILNLEALRALAELDTELKKKKLVESASKVTKQVTTKVKKSKKRKVKRKPKSKPEIVKPKVLKPVDSDLAELAEGTMKTKAIRKGKGKKIKSMLENKRESRLKKQKERIAKQKSAGKNRLRKQKERMKKQKERMIKQERARKEK